MYALFTWQLLISLLVIYFSTVYNKIYKTGYKCGKYLFIIQSPILRYACC